MKIVMGFEMLSTRELKDLGIQAVSESARSVAPQKTVADDKRSVITTKTSRSVNGLSAP